MRIPAWLAKKRHDICHICPKATGCVGKFTMLNPTPDCPLDKLPPLENELIWAKAWPQDANVISGCCDSALNY